ncbi:MAG: hypothetical protein IMF12_04910 [Proteobacteria bacterium]|nr:hypothetical protein [Pseudomonadota bacterium]
MRSLLFLLMFLVSNVVVAGSCNGECRNEGVVTSRCTVNCPSDMIASCSCGFCYCKIPPDRPAKATGYSIELYHYRWQKKWFFDDHTHWTICITEDNSTDECALLNTRITDGRDFWKYSLVTNCLGNSIKMNHDEKRIVACKFKQPE